MTTRPKPPLRELPTLVLLATIIGLMTVFVPAFRAAGNLTTVGENAAYIGIMACGEALIILGGGLDLSVGSILALAGCTTAAGLAAGWNWGLCAVLGLVVGAAAGALNGALITFRRLPPILTTLATLLLFRHGTSILTHSRNYAPFPDAFNLIGTGWTPFALFVVVAGVFTVITLRTRFGRWTVAMGGNEQAARLSGAPVDRVKRWTYILSGICAALAGLITMAFNNNAQATMGQGYELDVIAACVVGGIRITGGDGSLLGAACGALLIALLRDALILTGRPAEQYGLFTGAVILAAAVLEQWRSYRQARLQIEMQGETR